MLIIQYACHSGRCGRLIKIIPQKLNIQQKLKVALRDPVLFVSHFSYLFIYFTLTAKFSHWYLSQTFYHHPYTHSKLFTLVQEFIPDFLMGSKQLDLYLLNFPFL